MRCAALAAWLLAVPALGQVAPNAPEIAQDDTAAAMRGWTDAPAYTTLFAPAAHRSAYRIFVRREPLAAVLAALDGQPWLLHPPGGWAARSELPSDAFGQSGRYDRSALARVYGARRALVARGPRVSGGVVTEAWTLVSPYPDPSLTRLEDGTLLIVLRLP